MADLPKEPPSGPKEHATSAPSAEQAKQAAAPVAQKVKAWGEAAAALFKAALFVLPIAVIALLISVTLERELNPRAIKITIEPEAEKTLRALGSDADLPHALLNALNERLRGVRRIIEVEGTARLIETELSPISLKPFNLDLSTEDIGKIIRYLSNSPPSNEAHIDLICLPVPCKAENVSRATVIVTLSGTWGSQRLSSPLEIGSGGGSAALRRGLRRAMGQSADALLARADPLLASIYNLNAPMWMTFEDSRRQGWLQASGQALSSRVSGGSTCVADLVIGMSLFWRDAVDPFVKAEERAALASDPTCKVGAWTNVVFSSFLPAICSWSDSIRQASSSNLRHALQKLRGEKPVHIDDTLADRVYSAQIYEDL